MKTRKITWTAIGIALYVAVSMFIKIPLIGHISTDLGYIVLAVYAMLFGAWSAAIVGGAGCMLVSIITSGWFPLGWMLGNIFIGFMVGKCYEKNKSEYLNISIGIIAVFIGIVCIKTAVECMLFSIPLMVKISKNFIAFVSDSIVLTIGYFVAKLLKNRIRGR